jgi:hypothetical protein
MSSTTFALRSPESTPSDASVDLHPLITAACNVPVEFFDQRSRTASARQLVIKRKVHDVQ